MFGVTWKHGYLVSPEFFFATGVGALGVSSHKVNSHETNTHVVKKVWDLLLPW